VAARARAAGPAARFLGSRTLLWALLAAPGVWMLIAWWRGATFYGEVLHASGELAVQLLIATMAVTPLALMFPRARLTQWLRRRRRYLGVATFGYSLMHTVVYLARQADLGVILEDARSVAIWTGWIALILMLALAVTSNDASIRWLRRRWHRLHRLVYVAAILTLAHWILTAFDPTSAWVYAGILVAVQLVRVGASLWHRRARRPAAS